MGYMFGMPSLVQLGSIEDNVLLCKEIGLSFVELNMNMHYCLPSENDAVKLKELSERYKIGYTIHFPEDIDFGTYYKTIHDANIQLFEEMANWGNLIGVEKINVHLNPGVYITLPNKQMWAYESNIHVFTQNLIDSFKQISKIAQKYKIIVCVENTSVPKFLESVYEKLINLEGIYFTYDVGHDAKEHYNLREIYKKCGNKVKHMHLHDYDGKTDHQVLFNGNIDLNNRLSLAKQNDMSVVIEVKTVESLIKSIDNLRIRRFI